MYRAGPGRRASTPASGRWPAETNARFRYLLEHGQTGLSVAFDLPTQMGYDSDYPMAAGEVGKVGVAIDSWPTCAGCSRVSPSTRSRPR